MTPLPVTHRRCLGLTLVELLLALSITALVGASIAAMLTAVSYGTSSEKDLRTLVVKHKTTDARQSAAIRSSKMVLDQGADFMVLWTADLNGSGLPNLLEIRRIEYDSGTNELKSHETDFPDSWSQATIDAANAEYQLTDDFGAITSALTSSSLFPSSLWATDVTDWTVTLDNADPQRASLVSYRVTLQTGSMSDTTVNASALRN